MPTVRRYARRLLIVAFGTLSAVGIGLVPASAEAQNAARPGKWTIELYGGGSSASGSTTGTPIDDFPAGTPFTLVSGAPSRAVSSWFFGDGAALLNQVLTQFAAEAGTTFPRILPLDDALKADGGKLPGGAMFGVRLGRVLTPTLSLEVSVERSLAKMGLSDSLMQGLDAASESFKSAFEALLGSAPAANVAVTSSVTTRDASTVQTRIAAAVKWTVSSGSRIEAYLTGGGGLIRNSGEAPQAILNGRYTFRFFDLFPMDELDRVVITVTPQKSSAMGLVGGGVTYDLSPSSGLRADVRLLLNSAKNETTMTAAPGLVASTPGQVMPTASGISPGIQFSTQPGERSTLSGPNANLTLFTGSGLSKQISFTLGIFKRF
jgi:hypothetical protein